MASFPLIWWLGC